MMNHFTLKDLLRRVTPPRQVLLVIILMLLASSLLALVSPWLAGQVTAVILGEPAALPMWGLVAALGFALAARALVDFVATYRIAMESEYRCADLRQLVNDHCHRLPVSYFNDTNIGDISAYFSNDIEVIGRFVMLNIMPLVSLVPLLLVSILLMWQISTTITLLTIGLLPLYYLMTRVMARNLRPIASEWISAWAALMSLVEQRLGNMILLRMFSNRETESRLYHEKDQRYLDLTRQQNLVQSALTPAVSVLAGVGLVIVLLLGAGEIEEGTMTPPQLVTLLLYANLLRSPLASLAALYGQVRQLLGASDRLLSLLNTSIEESTGPALQVTSGCIELRDLTFGHTGALLKGINEKVSAGETVAIIGANGAGKSTLAYLIMGLIKPPEGAVLIDDQDVAACSAESVRSQVAFVPQQTLLLNDTVAANIALDQAADLDGIRQAAASVHADTFIEALPQGYETIIGNQGLRLSGGERQKISLARAMFKDAPIVVLDEPTSMFDPVTEQAFAEDCRALFRQRTVLLITHSARLLPLADRILELKDGRLISTVYREVI